MRLNDVFFKLGKKENLSPVEMIDLMQAIMTGVLRDPEIEEFLSLLRDKGETAEEIASAARVMRGHGLKLRSRHPELLDTCGTGGDSKNTLNVSTLSAIAAASMGVKIAKHGNRSVSSQCGSADILEALGVRIDLPVPAIETCIDRHNFGFFFAPKFHEAAKYAMPARKKIGGKTLFNLLGPLSNPAGALYQVIGVYEERLVETFAQTLLELGSKRALVVHGKDGLDEITICDDTNIAELDQGKVKSYTVSPADFQIKKAGLADIQCRTKEECKNAAVRVLRGEPGAHSDIVALNTGAALYVAGKAGSLKEGMDAAKAHLVRGAAYRTLEKIASFTQEIQ
ncbi:MAG: anthranilate phosphoribosyltransferase [Omnitrophica bacterium RIFCSPHIGHO2_02_FULL_51_18]|nr:MAG: anthranilate phosphoribosyltransferase [Omnitrophica bacterium RIFCSPHIGHO2_02_FULL_51_18]